MEGLEVLPTMFSIVIVLAVLGVTLFLLRWATNGRTRGSGGNRRSAQLIDVVERQSVGRNGSLVVIRYAGTEHVLGVTESSITPIAEGMVDLRDLENDEPEKRSRVSPSNVVEALRNKTVRR